MASLTGITEGVFAGQSGSYEGRIRVGAYRAPSGTRIEFQCLAVRRAFTARGTAFEFQGIDEAFVQRFGISSRRYGLACIFSGPTHDLEATAFEAALTEPGLGTLEHPLYGTIPNVTPLGEIERLDDLVENIDQTIVQLELWTSTGTAYPKPGQNFANEIVKALGLFDVELAQSLSKQAKLNTIARKANAIATTKKFLNTVSDGLHNASDTVSGARRQITELQADIFHAMDVLIDKPLQLVRQVVGLIRAPARALSSITERLAMYQRIARDLTASALSTPADTLAAGTALQSRSVKIANDFVIADTFAQAAVSGSVDAVRQHQFTSRGEAIRAAASVTELFEVVTAWREAQRQALVDVDPINIDTGESFQQLQHLVALATGRLVEVSFTLYPERYITLDRSRALLDVLGELYGRVDNDAIDYLINTNNLTGDEILELPRGKRVAYYRAQ
jgi:prophage DNA circulation protein